MKYEIKESKGKFTIVGGKKSDVFGSRREALARLRVLQAEPEKKTATKKTAKKTK